MGSQTAVIETKCLTDTDGDKVWCTDDGELHRDDGPAIEYPDGSKYWYKHNLRHRDDGPAIEYKNGDTRWYNNGKRHRDDGPAIMQNGISGWYQNDKLHRDGAPAIEWADGSTSWYQHGKLHRDGAPAIEWVSGSTSWYCNGNLHRTDGPAVEYMTSDCPDEWWVDGIELAPADFAAEVLDKDTALLWKMSGYCWPFDFGLNK